jgi:WhiB family redox-sensing transcriptional regulator
MPVPAWMEQAACVAVNPEIFYPEDRRGRDARVARTICASCPVIADCLTHALSHHENHGIWGGLDEADRRQIRRRVA